MITKSFFGITLSLAVMLFFAAQSGFADGPAPSAEEKKPENNKILVKTNSDGQKTYENLGQWVVLKTDHDKTLGIGMYSGTQMPVALGVSVDVGRTYVLAGDQGRITDTSVRAMGLIFTPRLRAQIIGLPGQLATDAQAQVSGMGVGGVMTVPGLSGIVQLVALGGIAQQSGPLNLKQVGATVRLAESALTIDIAGKYLGLCAKLAVLEMIMGRTSFGKDQKDASQPVLTSYGIDEFGFCSTLPNKMGTLRLVGHAKAMKGSSALGEVDEAGASLEFRNIAGAPVAADVGFNQIKTSIPVPQTGRTDEKSSTFAGAKINLVF